MSHFTDVRRSVPCDDVTMKGRATRRGTAMAPGTNETWLQRLLVIAFVVLAVVAWSQLASGLFV